MLIRTPVSLGGDRGEFRSRKDGAELDADYYLGNVLGNQGTVPLSSLRK